MKRSVLFLSPGHGPSIPQLKNPDHCPSLVNLVRARDKENVIRRLLFETGEGI